MADDFKYHIDHHAQLVPPPELVSARGAHTGGELDDGALRAVEDAAIADALRMQRRVGLAALSDGEFRRRNHLSVIYDGVDGFVAAGARSPFAELVGERHAPEARPLAGQPLERGRLVKHETDFLVSSIDRPTMLALPAPGFIAELGGAGEPAAAELARILRQELAAIAADGVRHALITNPGYGFLLSLSGRKRAAELGIDADATLDRMLTADAQVVDGLAADAEFRVSLDLTTAGSARGGYDAGAVQRFLAAQPFVRLCVEFPAPLEERFPLTDVADVVVSLGVVDVTTSDLEDVDELVARIDDAAEIVDVDNIAISTNGGFCTTDGGGDHQRNKLQLVEMTARYFWGNEL